METSQNLVSIIVRSMDRPTLKETLESISKQTHPNIEIVIVNATGKAHSQLQDHGGHFPINIISTGSPLARSSAANVGLDNSKGTYLAFLDDDDWINPDHIAKLVSLLSKSINCKVAYSGTKFSTDPGSTDFRVINEEFDAIKLKRGNFIPIHAVLFKRELIDFGCRFDESFELYEDWDFWLQLSRVSSFLHLNEVTAGYRNTGDSGASPSAEEKSIQKARERIFDKWKNLWSGAEINSLLSYTAEIQNPRIFLLEQKLAESYKMSDELKVELHGVTEQNKFKIDEMQQRINFVENTIIELNYEKITIEQAKQEDFLNLEKKISDATQAIEELQKSISAKQQSLRDRNTLISQIYNSTSWKITAPIRRAKMLAAKFTKNLKKFILSIRPLVRDPSRIYPETIKFKNAWQTAGLNEAKKVILNIPNDTTYHDLWISDYKKSFTPQVYGLIRERIDKMKSHPTITVLMPTYNTPEKLLRKAIDSVKNQLYPFWNLCIADDASTNNHVKRILEEYAASDSRIHFRVATNNLGVSATTNLALTMATGSFTALLDHDDILEPQAFFRIAECILDDDPDFIYSDEAIISEVDEKIIIHVHRPTFSPEYLRSHPYIVHLIVFRTSLLREIGGFDEGLRISQDYDLILRASEKAKKIVHIPEILYLWRLREQSTGHQLKSDVMQTSRSIISRHLERCNEAGTLEDGAHFNFFRVRYPLNEGSKVAIIIPTKNHGALVKQCIESIVRTVKVVDYDIILIDHASDDQSSISYFNQLKSLYQVFRYEGAFNFSMINNWAISQARGNFSHYLFCNNDIEAIEDGWLEKMLALCQKPNIGMVGAKLLYPDRRIIQHAGVCVGMYGIAEHYGKFMDGAFPDGNLHPGYQGRLIANHEVSAVTAACALMRKEVFNAVGGYEEKLAVGFGDVDLCLKTLDAGYRILFCAEAVLIHHESVTRGKSRVDPHPEDSAYFSAKWRAKLHKCDPYYNPNLGLQNTKWEARQPLQFNLDIDRRTWERQE